MAARSDARGLADARRPAITLLTGIAASYAAGRRAEGFTRKAAFAEIAEVSTDPDLLALAAAMYASWGDRYCDNAADLLVEAGADGAAVTRYASNYARPTGGASISSGSPDG